MIRSLFERVFRKTTQYEPSPGDICSVASGNLGFAIAKVLAVDAGVVHVRLYREKFPCRPLQVDPSKLSLGKVGDVEGFGMGHLPLSRATFAGWEPVLIQSEPVTEEELDGYRIWQGDTGGVW